MKHTRSLVNGLVAGAVALAMVSTLAAQSAVEGTAKVIRVRGDARYSTGGNDWRPLTVGTVLRPGAVVQTSTAQGSFVDLALGGEGAVSTASQVAYRPHIASSYSVGYQPTAEQNVIRLGENTALGIDKLTTTGTGSDQVSETQLDLKQGHLTGNVKKLSAASKYEIKLPNGVAGIRGTAYDVTADGVLKVYTGSVVMSWVDKSGNVVTQAVMAGQQYDAKTGQITPLSQQDMRELERIVDTLVLVPGGVAPTVLTSESTIINLSPVR